jgi:hypothetical protein
LSFRFSAAQRKLSYLICCPSGNAWLMLFNVWNPSLTTVVLILSLVTTTGFSMITGTFLLPLLIVPSARLFALRQSNGFLCGPFRLIHNRLVNGYRLRVLGDAYNGGGSPHQATARRKSVTYCRQFAARDISIKFHTRGFTFECCVTQRQSVRATKQASPVADYTLVFLAR